MQRLATKVKKLCLCILCIEVLGTEKPIMTFIDLSLWFWSNGGT